MAHSHPYSWKVFLPFSVPEKWREPAVVVQVVAAVAVVISLLITSYQIRQSTNATNAQNIYAAEKDYSTLFAGAGKSEAFQSCFGVSANPPRTCISRDARQTFYEILQHYRLLGIMANKNAIPTDYYHFRIEGFCPYAKSPAAKAELDELLKRGNLDKGLSADLAKICKT